MGLIQKYLLPKEIDFNAALNKQAAISQDSVQQLIGFCLGKDKKAYQHILKAEQRSRKTKRENMRKLLDVFITPSDKESIYRMIVQLDWIALSVKHLAIDIDTYEVTCPDYYKAIFTLLSKMMERLEVAFNDLDHKNLERILETTEQIHDYYDDAVKQCALAVVRHLNEDEIKVYLGHQEVLAQLKDVAKHIHVSANTLEDMAMKIV